MPVTKRKIEIEIVADERLCSKQCPLFSIWGPWATCYMTGRLKLEISQYGKPTGRYERGQVCLNREVEK